MDDLRIPSLLLCLTLFSSSCQNESVKTAPSQTQSKNTKSAANQPEKKLPTPEELKRQEIDKSFKEFLAAQDEPDPEKWKSRYDNSFETILKYGKEALPTLLHALDDKDQKIRESASIIVSAIGPSTPEESGQFIPHLKDESEMVRVNLVACLSLVPERSDIAIAQLKELLSSKDDSIRTTAAGSAANLGEKAAPLTDLLLEIVADNYSQARNLALEALGRVPTFTAPQQQKINELATADQQDPNITQKLKSLLEKK